MTGIGRVARWKKEWPVARKMAADGFTLEAIAKALDRSPHSVWLKFDNEGARQPQRATKQKPGPVTGTTCAHSRYRVEPLARVCPQALADRAAREAAAERRTPTQVFFGDPPPGFSALDRKRQQQERGPRP